MSSTRTAAPAQGWAVKAHDACDTLVWLAGVHALWVLGTLAGGVVLGLAPAGVAAAAVSRRRLRGETAGTAACFVRTWRAEFTRANVALLPAVLAGALLLANQRVFSARTGAVAELVTAATVLAGLVLAVVVLVAVPLYVHYELPLQRYLPTAAAFVLSNPAAVLPAVLGAAAVVVATTALPGLALFLSAAALVHVTTAACVGAFERNDERVAARQPVG
ncbi:DUF624 domain-containing protein [Kineococcus sp. G2]|uniref:DUF624 domain-containing protein n=1 Tax=Kineococcus sp. G2 TaxID=3127484 RepID=UPI00301C2A4A